MSRDPGAFLDGYESLTLRVRRTRLRRSPRLLDAVAEFFAWCDARGVDPAVWARARHEAAWHSRPDALIPIEKLPAEGFLAAYNEWAAGEAAEAISQERLAASAVEDDPSGEDGELVPFAECMKQTLALERARCMVDRDTLGWHPASRWCVACPLADPCRERLGRRRPSALARRIARAS